jgi:hypothetical protein
METIDGLDFDETSLPDPLRPLVEQNRRFAIGDDVDRERVLEKATAAELEQLVQTVNRLWPDIRAFLEIASRSNEECLTDSLAQAAMEAQIELKRRVL